MTSVIKSDLKDQMTKALMKLSAREEDVLRKRFGIGFKTKQTLEETGRDFNVTRERIRQIQVKAMKKLQHPTRSKILRSFVEK